MADFLLTLGEVQTGLLLHSTAVSLEVASHLLQASPGSQVYRSERPIAYARSEPMLTGVDCLLPDVTGRRVRCIGTASSHSTLIGGRVVQSSTHVTIDADRGDQHRPWAHYLARPGWVETLSKPNGEHVAQGFVAGDAAPDRLDLSAIAGRALDVIQESADLDHRPPFKIARTRLRWLIDPDGPDGPTVTFAVVDRTSRVTTVAHRESDLNDCVSLCEDLAFHDWLLTTLLVLVDRSRLGSSPRHVAVQRLAPAIDHLLHLWMPAARVHPRHADAWIEWERHASFTRQWVATVGRIRDQLALATWEGLNPAARNDHIAAAQRSGD